MTGLFLDKITTAYDKDSQISHPVVAKITYIKKAAAMVTSERHNMICKENRSLSLTPRRKLFNIDGSSIYYMTVGMDAETPKLIQQIDRVFAKFRFYGVVRSLRICTSRSS